MPNVEEIASICVDSGLAIHKELGPGLLESAYEAALAYSLEECGLKVARQVPIPIVYRALKIEQAFRADIIVEEKLLIELKAVEKLQPIHGKQVLTYLRFLDMPLGLLMNFSHEKFVHGLKRIVNNHNDTSGSNLKLHQ